MFKVCHIVNIHISQHTYQQGSLVISQKLQHEFVSFVFNHLFVLFFLFFMSILVFFREEYRDDPNDKRSYRDDPNSKRSQMARSSSTGGAPGGGYSGSSYDRWSYEQASRTGTGGSNDNPLNKLQYKYWVTKSKVVRKLGKDEDECVVASDAELDAKLELYNSISQTTKDLQRILDQYNDRLCSKLSLVLYMSSSFWLLAVESRDFFSI